MAVTIHNGKRRKRATPEYISWRAMKVRCYIKDTHNYKWFGGSGISVCDRWLKGENGKHPFICFLEDMGKRPTLAHTLDRYPDSSGNYEPKNCRWATKQEQAINRKWRKPNQVGYTGVYKSYGANGIRYRAKVAKKNIGSFTTPEEAALAYNVAAIARGKITGLNWVMPQVREI